MTFLVSQDDQVLTTMLYKRPSAFERDWKDAFRLSRVPLEPPQMRSPSDALTQFNHDVTKALLTWEPLQLAYGKQLLASAQQRGDRSQFSHK
ncbi:MAG: hypothetical protein KME45_13860 [Stenomitos rutilans HA7619-LM2]|nr:hypothetical protein [Stenomitos rutilans HA7619-LM2]